MKPSFVFSIKTKFFLVAALMMALSSATWGGWAWYAERQHLHERLLESGKQLLFTLSVPIINAFIYEEVGVMDDVGVLDTFVDEVVKSTDTPTVYAFITDRQGMVLAHNDYTRYGTIASDPLTRAALGGKEFLSTIVQPDPDGIRILDLALPLRVGEKSWGTLRVGYSLEPLEQELAALKRQLLTFSGIFFLLGTALFYVIGLTMSRPLEQLSRAMTVLDRDSLEVMLPPARRRDEIGRLQESFRDMVLRLQQSERERRLAVERLVRAEKLAAIGELVAGVAHEVNNPLAAMSVSISSLGKRVPTELARHVEILGIGAARIETIVRQLTDFSRTGEIVLRPTASDAFFKEAAGFAGMALKRGPIRFVTRDDCPRIPVCLDKGKLNQVILNLLRNAADASPAGGVVELTAWLEGDWYLLAVKDQGLGISPEEQERIFELFYTTKPAGEGSGIGLAICKNIVEMHRGAINVTSCPGETVFTVKIPAGGGDADE